MVNKLKNVLLCAILLFVSQSRSVFAVEEIPTNSPNSCGFGYELFIARMEYLEHKLFEQQLEIKTLISQIAQNQNEKFSQQEQNMVERFKSSDENVKQQIQLMVNEKIEGVVIPKLNQLSESISQLQSENEERFEQTKAEISKQSIKESVSNNFTMVLNDLKLVKSRVKATPVRSCSEELTKESGQYWLQPSDWTESFQGYCEQERFGGGWLVIQYRFDGSVDFYRNWIDYKAGFGSLSGEFWLGLQTLHRLTKEKPHTLIVEVEDFDGKYGYARYDRFEIGSEVENYAMKELGKYSGTAGDSLAYHKGMSFSTKDRDHDLSIHNCATKSKGAWWYKTCHFSNLNGPYVNEQRDWDSNSWYHLNNLYDGLKMTRMMIKEI